MAQIERKYKKEIQEIEVEDGYALHLSREEARHLKSVLGRIRLGSMTEPDEDKLLNSKIYVALSIFPSPRGGGRRSLVNV